MDDGFCLIIAVLNGVSANIAQRVYDNTKVNLRSHYESISIDLGFSTFYNSVNEIYVWLRYGWHRKKEGRYGEIFGQ